MTHPDRPPLLPWPARGVLAGAMGTLAMSLAYYAERRLQRQRGGHHQGAATLADGAPVRGLASHTGLDYDDTVVPGQIVVNILHLPATIGRHPGDVAIALRWGYGSAFGLAHVVLRHRLPEPAASAIFGGALMAITLSMFPLLGRTPPPWRWAPAVLATSVGTHAAYVLAAAVTDDALR